MPTQRNDVDRQLKQLKHKMGYRVKIGKRIKLPKGRVSPGDTRPTKKQSKYRNQPVIDPVHGRFDSGREFKRFLELKCMENLGLITDLRRQVKYALEVNGLHVSYYIADFVYYTAAPKTTVVEDSKGFRTREYQMKKKMMKSIHGIDIVEV